jgi:hypothetical protein
MERLVQGHLYPLLKQPRDIMSRPGIEPGSTIISRNNKYLTNDIYSIFHSLVFG